MYIVVFNSMYVCVTVCVYFNNYCMFLRSLDSVWIKSDCLINVSVCLRSPRPPRSSARCCYLVLRPHKAQSGGGGRSVQPATSLMPWKVRSTIITGTKIIPWYRKCIFHVGSLVCRETSNVQYLFNRSLWFLVNSLTVSVNLISRLSPSQQYWCCEIILSLHNTHKPFERVMGWLFPRSTGTAKRFLPEVIKSTVLVLS